MKPIHYLQALVVIIASSCSTSAHSTHAPLLKRATNPVTTAFEILPRQPQYDSILDLHRRSESPAPHTLQFDDSFRLSISVFDEVFHLHLRPNEHLIHPAARVTYYGLDSNGASTIVRTEPLPRESVKAYMGEVIASDYTQTRMLEDAARIVRYDSHPSELGWARIMVHHQGDPHRGVSPVYEGAFSANGVIYHVSTLANYLLKKHELDADVVPTLVDGNEDLVIWRDSDVMTPEEEHFVKTGVKPDGPISPPRTCAHDTLDFNQPETNPVLRAAARPSWLDALLNPPAEGSRKYRRQDGVGTRMDTNFREFIGQSTGCPTSQRVLYMGVAADCEYVAKTDGPERAKEQILNTWNTASALFRTTFNVSLGITELAVQDRACPAVRGDMPWNVPCNAANLQNRLSLFSEWRGTRSGDGNGLWHLMSGCPTGSDVGIAWLGTICQTDVGGTPGNITSGTGVSTSGRTEWQVVAHEIGHNFGAIHDCADGCQQDSSRCCPLTTTSCNADARFIMSPVAQAGEKVFSPCSLGNVCALMGSRARGSQPTDSTCLVDPNSPEGTRPLISLQMCGNGIVEKEAGEDCDPGSNVDSPCCDPQTCKFRTGAQCDPFSSDCCTDQCRFAPSTRVCRPAKDARCDTQETCTGNSSTCPNDVTAPNGQSCGTGELACASGWCTSVGEQCRAVGSSMNLTQACPATNDQSCQISCKDPQTANFCITLKAMLIDGSPCGYGGTCAQGRCQSGGLLATIKAWYRSNLQIAIPVTIVAGLIVLLILWGIFRGIRRCCSRSRSSSRASVPLAMNSAIGMAQHRRLASNDALGGSTNYRTPPPASRSQYTRVPPLAAHDRSRSGQEADLGYNYNANNRANWVDDRAYNGK